MWISREEYNKLNEEVKKYKDLAQELCEHKYLKEYKISDTMTTKRCLLCGKWFEEYIVEGDDDV